MKNVVLLTPEAHSKALDTLVSQGLAEYRPGKNCWRLTWDGQDEGIKIFQSLAPTRKVLLLGMLHGLGIKE